MFQGMDANVGSGYWGQASPFIGLIGQNEIATACGGYFVQQKSYCFLFVLHNFLLLFNF